MPGPDWLGLLVERKKSPGGSSGVRVCNSDCGAQKLPASNQHAELLSYCSAGEIWLLLVAIPKVGNSLQVSQVAPLTMGDASNLSGRDYAIQLDTDDVLRHTRDEFNIPSKPDVARKTLPSGDSADANDRAIYLVGNSLGLQPKRTAERIQQYLATWRTQGVQGHFKTLGDSPLPTWLDVDARAAEMIAPIVGGKVSEVAVMQTLTANLHFLMAAFYKPDIKGRHKIILEGKAFPSDHYAVETQIRHHGLRPGDSMITLEPPNNEDILSNDYIESVIEQHASTTAVLLLPGIQYYSGQLLDIKHLTAFARERGIFVIWDLAHAAGNAPLSLHEWNVDAAAWCTYKYLNGGPGCIGGVFVHERHAQVGEDGTHNVRLAGWWGNDKTKRFEMRPGFIPVPGAAGFQLSNPSVLDITSLCASLEIFEVAGGMGFTGQEHKADGVPRLGTEEATGGHERILANHHS
ncbi:hypothetical protein NXS19_007439 [Fusarium pseudograminearum]|nr:hypothetical protein NXS19_007439 [Fusarium pseudograminearum]